ncbi:hypothetical protein OEZ85_012616 [Tetradesmus obliquus]|uniref:Uncharacterized protein n=1 Tax=Tetradesmus obliquus TaxID=3088 RepID=A0ABY8U334_TETOB|nr:hypothetical protein OEZ85_012616 [Tetradesmus obliquus]
MAAATVLWNRLPQAPDLNLFKEKEKDDRVLQSLQLYRVAADAIYGAQGMHLARIYGAQGMQQQLQQQQQQQQQREIAIHLRATGLNQALTEATQVLELRLAAPQRQQQQQQQMLQQQFRVFLLTRTLLRSAAALELHSFLFGNAASMQIQPAAARVAVLLLRSGVQIADAEVAAVLNYCVVILPSAARARSAKIGRHSQHVLLQWQQLAAADGTAAAAGTTAAAAAAAAAAGTEAAAEAAASAESDCTAAVAGEALLHIEELKLLAAFQLAVAALKLHNSSSSRRSRQ